MRDSVNHTRFPNEDWARRDNGVTICDRVEQLSQKTMNAAGYVTGNSARQMRKSSSVMV